MPSGEHVYYRAGCLSAGIACGAFHYGSSLGGLRLLGLQGGLVLRRLANPARLVLVSGLGLILLRLPCIIRLLDLPEVGSLLL